MEQKTMNVTQYKRKHLIKIKIFSNEICLALCTFVFTLSITLCFLLLILNQTSGCCLTTWGDPQLCALLPASSTTDSANRQCFSWFFLSSTYCTLNTNILINWRFAFEYLIGLEASMRVQMQKYFSVWFYCLAIYNSIKISKSCNSVPAWRIWYVCLLSKPFFIVFAINFATFCNALHRILQYLKPSDGFLNYEMSLVNHKDIWLEIFQILNNKIMECVIFCRAFCVVGKQQNDSFLRICLK